MFTATESEDKKLEVKNRRFLREAEKKFFRCSRGLQEEWIQKRGLDGGRCFPKNIFS